MEKISVIVPCYNVENYLSECLDSLLKQTYGNMEIICINDASTDKTKSILKLYENLYPSKIKVVNFKDNQGLSCARNFGVSIAQGELIGFVDSDDLVSPYMYQDLQFFMKEYKAEIVSAQLVNFKKNSEITNLSDKPQDNNFSIHHFQENPNDLFHVTPSCWNRLYKREILPEKPFLEHKIFEDNAFTYPIFLKTKTAIQLESYYYFYRKNPNGITHNVNFKNEKILDVFDICNAMLSKTDEKYHDVIHPIVKHILLKVTGNLRVSLRNDMNLFLSEENLFISWVQLVESLFPGFSQINGFQYSPTINYFAELASSILDENSSTPNTELAKSKYLSCVEEYSRILKV